MMEEMEGKHLDDEPIFTVDELADKLKLKRSWIYSQTRIGKIPCIRFGRHIRFRLSEVLSHFSGE